MSNFIHHQVIEQQKEKETKLNSIQHNKRTGTKLGKRAFSVSGPVAWNALKIFIHQSMVGNWIVMNY